MKFLSFALVLSLSLPLAYAGVNYSDDLDRNNSPAALEEREEEIINQSDSVDENVTPSGYEDQTKQEEVESDLDQRDDPEKSYEAIDEEFDE